MIQESTKHFINLLIQLFRQMHHVGDILKLKLVAVILDITFMQDH